MKIAGAAPMNSKEKCRGGDVVVGRYHGWTSIIDAARTRSASICWKGTNTTRTTGWSSGLLQFQSAAARRRPERAEETASSGSWFWHLLSCASQPNTGTCSHTAL